MDIFDGGCDDSQPFMAEAGPFVDGVYVYDLDALMQHIADGELRVIEQDGETFMSLCDFAALVGTQIQMNAEGGGDRISCKIAAMALSEAMQWVPLLAIATHDMQELASANSVPVEWSENK